MIHKYFLLAANNLKIEEIYTGVIVGLILMIITGLVGYLKGKRLSIDPIKRKEEIYIPLIMNYQICLK